MVCRPVCFVNEVFAQLGLHHAGANIGISHEAPNCGADEQLETNERTHGIAGQAEDEMGTPRAKENRFAWLHFDFVEVGQNAEFLQDAGYQVKLAGGDASGKDEDR
jgi:hypothetical protein